MPHYCIKLALKKPVIRAQLVLFLLELEFGKVSNPDVIAMMAQLLKLLSAFIEKIVNIFLQEMPRI